MMKKRLLSAVMASAMVLSLAACGGAKTETTAAETTAEKKEETTTAGTTAAETAEAAGGTLIVGFDQDFPPMGFVGDNGEYTGFDLDLAKEVASRLGLEYKAQPVAWDSKDMELESGNIDCIWNGFTITGREDDYTWTTPYMANKQVFVVANDSDIKSQADLAGKVVEVQADSSAEAALKENQDLANTFGQLLTTPDYNTAFMNLESGAVDAIAVDIGVAQYQLASRGDTFRKLDEPLSTEQYGIGFKKGNEELRDQVQDTLFEMYKDGTFDEIAAKYTDYNLPDMICLGDYVK